MNFELPPVGGIGHTPPAPSGPRAGKSGSSFSLPEPAAGGAIPASPPPDVLEQMYDAAKVADSLRAQSRELHFEPLRDGRVQIQVRDLDGQVLRTITPSEALDVAAGSPLRP
jgi:hypothetical protein